VRNAILCRGRSVAKVVCAVLSDPVSIFNRLTRGSRAYNEQEDDIGERQRVLGMKSTKS
jgi:hypothetical protein